MDAALLSGLLVQIEALKGNDEGLLSPERVAVLEQLVALRDSSTITIAEYKELKAAMF